MQIHGNRPISRGAQTMVRILLLLAVCLATAFVQPSAVAQGKTTKPPQANLNPIVDLSRRVKATIQEVLDACHAERARIKSELLGKGYGNWATPYGEVFPAGDFAMHVSEKDGNIPQDFGTERELKKALKEDL